MTQASSLTMPFETPDVRGMFEQLVPHYDRFNFLSSLGLDRRWRKTLVSMIPDGASVLDVGTGTGDMALASLEKAREVTGVDFSESMIQAALKKAAGKTAVRFQVGEANHLQFQEGSFDAVMSSFVLRNLYRLNLLKSSFEESLRVLKNGGRFFSLELTRPVNRWLRWGHHAYLKTALPLIGKSLFGKKWPGAYLESSIQEFPSPDQVMQMLSNAGFTKVTFQPLSLGIAGIFCAVKPS